MNKKNVGMKQSYDCEQKIYDFKAVKFQFDRQGNKIKVDQ